MPKTIPKTKHTPCATFPCRELTCDRLALSRALCAKHYSYARHGGKLALKYCTDTEPQLVPWINSPEAVPSPADGHRFGLELPARQKWEWAGDESALGEANSLDDSQSEEKTT
jgi:hypothetical protein